MLGSLGAVEGSPWVVSIEFPYAEVVAPIMGLARRLAVFGTVLLLLGGLIAFRVARSMARPIAELADAAEGLRAGDYSRRAPNGRGDELGELANAFNSMATSTADARVKLEDHAKQSEERNTALADALFGAYNPGGRLPLTYPRSLADVPDFIDYSMIGRTYRYSDKTPLYPFGYGLSYTRFRYSELMLSSERMGPGDTLEVSVTVTKLPLTEYS